MRWKTKAEISLEQRLSMSTPNSELPTLASFSVLSTDTSWTLGKITCLQSDLPEYAQDFFFFLMSLLL